MENTLLQPVEYKVEETAFGVWRRFGYPNGTVFEEFRSHGHFFNLPILHYTRGKCPETGRRIVARGFIAIGRLAIGVIAIGHASAGVFAIGQLALGLLFGLGQATTGIVAAGQLAIGLAFGLGQFASGYVAIGQFGIGHYVLAQIGVGTHVVDMRGVSGVAAEFFRSLLPKSGA
ncbi:MAG: hypothetical protein CMJ18_04990 [Phycisphaeraceae bacterium]|nr:hypothetical protein [Phycisphaeraceae bacterium]